MSPQITEKFMDIIILIRLYEYTKGSNILGLGELSQLNNSRPE